MDVHLLFLFVFAAASVEHARCNARCLPTLEHQFDQQPYGKKAALMSGEIVPKSYIEVGM